MSKGIRFGMILGGVVASMAAASQAALITPGQTALAVFENDPTGGTVVATTSQPFATAGYSGTLVSTVISGDTTNTLGGLTFTYSIIADAGNSNNITRLGVNGFAGTTTDFSYKLGTGTVSPTVNDRDATGNVVGFTYIGSPLGQGLITPGAITNLMVIQTNATGFRPAIANVIDGAVSAVNSYAPTIVPEPVSAAALLMAGTFIRRRR